MKKRKKIVKKAVRKARRRVTTKAKSVGPTAAFYGGFGPSTPPVQLPPPTIREQTLERARTMVVGDRNRDYSNPENNFDNIAKMFNIYHKAKPTQPLSSFPLNKHDVAVFMILTKVARIAQSPGKADHWDDIAGYAACGAECV